MRHIIALAAMLIALAAPAQKQRFMHDGEKKIYYSTVADAESKLIDHIKKSNSRRGFPEKLFMHLIKNDERCFTYGFSKLEKASKSATARPFSVRTSKDEKLRLYSWDIDGGTMSGFSGITSYKDGDKIYTHTFISREIGMDDYEKGLDASLKTGAIACGAYDIKELELNDGRKVYVVFSFSSGSSILHSISLEAYTIDKGELKEYRLFSHDSKKSHWISYGYSPAGAYIGDIEFNSSSLYIPETRAGYNPYGGDYETGRLLHYQFNGSTFSYAGIEYPKGLNNSLCNFGHNMIIIEQAPWIIRIDIMPDGKARYSSWKNKSSKEKPDLVVKNGTHTSQPATGDDDESTERYTFKNGEYTYEVSWTLNYFFSPINPSDWKVIVKRKDKVLMTLKKKH